MNGNYYSNPVHEGLEGQEGWCTHGHTADKWHSWYHTKVLTSNLCSHLYIKQPPCIFHS